MDQGRSIFASGYDVETSRFNVWVETDSVEGGWAPNLNDEEKWIKVGPSLRQDMM